MNYVIVGKTDNNQIRMVISNHNLRERDRVL